MQANRNMKRSFTVIDGNEKGTIKPFEAGADYMLVGRSGDAGIRLEDPEASRRHLEVRIKAGAVSAKNLSPYGFEHNNQSQRGDAEVRLKPGDVLTVGATRLRYDEATSQTELSSRPERVGSESPDEGETRAANEDELRKAANLEEEGSDSDGTRGPGSDETRPLDPRDVPEWAPPEVKRVQRKQSLRLWGALVLLLGLIGAGLWLKGPKSASESPGEVRDPLRGFSIECPPGWAKITTGPELASFGWGQESAATDQDWVRVNVYSDKQARHAATGLTLGFGQHKDIWKRRFPRFQLTGSKVLRVNDATVINFGFTAVNLEGLGFFLLNGDTRIVVECFSSAAQFLPHRQAFIEALQSFHLISLNGPQQFIDFPLPDEEVRRQAAVTPEQVKREAEEFARRGDDFQANQEVRPDNRYRSVNAYSKAIQLQLALQGTAQSPDVSDLARKLVAATKDYREVVARQQFEISRAIKLGRAADVSIAASKLIQMVPDKSDPICQEAQQILRTLTNNRKQP